MQRDIIKHLVVWKNQSEHLPILLRGARQIGKTYAVEQFAKQHFDYLVNINFELESDYIDCFKTLKPKEILDQIALKQDVPIVFDKTLLFLDEIQVCPQAIMALRYFKEQMPQLHVIGAGSLLEFALNDENFRMPVGRVQYMHMHPLSFYEFLIAIGKSNLLEHIKRCDLRNLPSIIAHQELTKLLRKYFVLGGMPAILNCYVERNDLIACQNLQTGLLATYRNDFGKYARQTKHKYLQMAFDKAPILIGKQVKYKHVDADSQVRDIKRALFLLGQAGVLYKVNSSACSGLPLNALINEKKFKLLFVDIGLINRASKLNIQDLISEDLMLINQGAIAEQFVGQELLAYQNPYEEPEIYFWDRDKKGSQAEVDYVISLNSNIIPIEVKSGKIGRLKSLKQFMQEKSVPIGVQISPQPLEFKDNIIKLPLYMIGELKRIYENAKL
ncbi:MAG: ATP-binding protein [Gammaproteobacteria bacterium]